MTVYYSLWGIVAPPPGQQPTQAQIVKLEEATDEAEMLLLAKAYLEELYGWCDELRVDGPFLAHPRSPRGKCGQADLVLVAIHQPDPVKSPGKRVQGSNPKDRAGRGTPPPSVALYRPRLTALEHTGQIVGNRWFARALLVVLVAALVLRGFSAA